ncbi:MAG: response regulator [Terracidiphilus sp.]|jgi:CheY-like chemotaxis protein
MPCTKERLLIVDDEPSIRTSLSWLLSEIGYSVRAAEDGLSALIEIQKQIPEILVSDLNMPRMSGYELLRVVRAQYPAIRVVAMSGAYPGDQIPSGVVADAFFQKGRGFGEFLKMMKSLPQPDRMAQQQAGAAPSPVWISRYERNAAGEGYATIECSECLGTFPKALNGTIDPINETNCLFCGHQVRYTIFQGDDTASLLPFRRAHSSRTPGLQSARELDQ